MHSSQWLECVRPFSFYRAQEKHCPVCLGIHVYGLTSIPGFPFKSGQKNVFGGGAFHSEAGIRSGRVPCSYQKLLNGLDEKRLKSIHSVLVCLNFGRGV